MKHYRTYFAILLTAAIAFSLLGCSSAQIGGTAAHAADLMGDVAPSQISGRRADAGFAGSMAEFSVELFKKSVADGNNSLVSPLSVILALAMAANGADGETLA